MNATTRRWPRTMNEAFPGGTEYACAIERSRRTDFSCVWIVLIAAALIAAPWAIMAWWPA